VFDEVKAYKNVCQFLGHPVHGPICDVKSSALPSTLVVSVTDVSALSRSLMSDTHACNYVYPVILEAVAGAGGGVAEKGNKGTER